MTTRENILAHIRQQGSVSSRALREHLGISRQVLNYHVQALTASGDIIRTGATRNVRYHIAGSEPKPLSYQGDFDLAGLQEGEVYERASLSLNLRRELKLGVESIAHYAFTEILNNAIEHSESAKARVTVALKRGSLEFEIRDWGIGAFASLAQKLGFPDEHDAMIQLVKGKTTTAPQAHAGEGIFFVSKAVNRMELRSHRITLMWDHAHQDVFVSNDRFLKGTRVRLTIDRESRVDLQRIFEYHAPEEFDYQFSRTRVQVKLLGKEYVSRSVARRLLLNLDRFRMIELDFKAVKSIGQGFADEVFRVFTQAHPDIDIQELNASQAVSAMIRHAG